MTLSEAMERCTVGGFIFRNGINGVKSYQKGNMHPILDQISEADQLRRDWMVSDHDPELKPIVDILNCII